jgi:hypothetical protein
MPPRSRSITPLVTPRRVLTLGLLITSILIVILAQSSFSRPSSWRWVIGTAEDSPPAGQERLEHGKTRSGPSLAVTCGVLQGCSLLGAPGPLATPGVFVGSSFCAGAGEYVLLPSARAGDPGQRQAPYPDPRLLAGAADLQPFLAEPSDALPELQASAQAAADATARYHLLQLARAAPPGSLEADGSTDIRYRLLLRSPREHRGALVKISGTLISIGEPMEMTRKVAGVEVCYQGVMVGEFPEQQYLVLFTDLPPGLPANRGEWRRLVQQDAVFAGYFYKVARFTEKGRKEPWQLPVLVGKSPRWPVRQAAAPGWGNLLTVFGAMTLPVVLIILLLPRFYRYREARHARLMSAFQSRRPEIQSMAAPEWRPSQETAGREPKEPI